MVIADSAHRAQGAYQPNSIAQPYPVPTSGEWWDSFSGYGNADFFTFKARANRSFDLRLWALDDSLRPTTHKAMPEIGVWINGDAAGSTPRLNVSSFNTFVPGLTSLSASVGANETVILGLADLRGDGRPDFRYRARLLYADAVAPARVTGPGSMVEITGIGLRPGVTVRMNGISATIYAADESHVLATVPTGVADTSADVIVADPRSQAASQMIGALQVGAAAGDSVTFLTQGAPPAPLGSSVVLRARVTDAGAQPVGGETVTFSVVPATSTFAGCAAATCAVSANSAGEATVSLNVFTAGTNTITAMLGKGQTAVTTISGSAPASAVVPQPGDIYVPSGANRIIPLSALWLVNGQATAGHSIKFTVTTAAGSGSATATADANGIATVNLQVFGFTDIATTTICAIEGSPCALMHIYPVAASDIRLTIAAGDGQILAPGQSPQPLRLRITDINSPADRIFGVSVTYGIAVLPPAAAPDCASPEGGCHMSDNKVIASFRGTAVSDFNGNVLLTPTLQAAWGQARVVFQVGADNAPGQTVSATWHIIAPGP